MFKKLLFSLVGLFFTMNVAFAVGEPMNQDFTDLIKATSEAIELGKQGKNEEFLTALDKALDVVKDQKLNGDSPKLQKVGSKLKAAKKLGKDGKTKEAADTVEDALSVVK